ncbi:hypothetical protein GCM10009837_74400 [Streptomyces durmitorensis]|uniref:Uncharacterized protein n=1 Tax=Streptomyces durmitorensis TaxID=319947 RepID=A0ABY4PJM7_9ACTN|nr:hypothetical protein [Streptomyces durmitorensis]UQT53835.1 hypothetical protein M4V62_01390 [Streptomyces durmitorensis]
MSEVRRRLAVAAAALTVLGGALWSLYSLTGPRENSGPTEAVALYDPQDARQVAGTADDVFLGTVVSRTGERDIYGVFSDLYAVRVGQVFKGTVRDTTTVSYYQGEEPLTDGASYVFATGRVPDGQSHAVLLETIPAPVADLNAPARTITAVAASDGRTIREYWKWAVDHEIDVSPGQER